MCEGTEHQTLSHHLVGTFFCLLGHLTFRSSGILGVPCWGADPKRGCLLSNLGMLGLRSPQSTLDLDLSLFLAQAPK